MSIVFDPKLNLGGKGNNFVFITLWDLIIFNFLDDPGKMMVWRVRISNPRAPHH